MEFLKYGDCPLELQNLGRAKLMLELSTCTFIEKQSLRSENTDMPGTDKSPNIRTSCISRVSEDLDTFPDST